jgi:hypothetical protein
VIGIDRTDDLQWFFSGEGGTETGAGRIGDAGFGTIVHEVKLL